MVNIPTAWALLTCAWLTLTWCGEQKPYEQYSQEGYLTSIQEVSPHSWKITTVEFFDEDAQLQEECSLDPKESHKDSLPLYYIIDDTKEMVIACIYQKEWV